MLFASPNRLTVDAALVACFLLSVCSSPLAASTPELLVPAYAHPCCSRTWQSYLDLAQSRAVPLNLIINPNSGPGDSPIDVNYVAAGGESGVLFDLDEQQVSFFGYVRTNYARQPIETVFAEIDRYYSADYWRNSPIRPDGIFLDEYSNNLANVGYYQRIAEHLRRTADTAQIIGNPGVSSYFDSSQGAAGFSLRDFVESADVLVTFENVGRSYRESYDAPVWQNDYPASHFAHIVHSESFLNIPETLQLASRRNAGMIYVTDDLMPNPYDKLPTYWLAEVNRLAAMRLDLNQDGEANAGDVDSLVSAMNAPDAIDRHYDLNDDNRVDFDDLIEYVEVRLNTHFGDANLDGQFNSSDLVQVFSAGEYDDPILANSTWETGDWNGDFEFDSSDFIVAFSRGGYEQGPRTNRVPEPVTWNFLLLLVVVAGVRFRVGRSRATRRNA